MATFSQLPSGRWRVQVRRGGVYRAGTFDTRREANEWAAAMDKQARLVSVAGYAPAPRGATLSDLIDKYIETLPREPGRTKLATLKMLRAQLGGVRLQSLGAHHLAQFVDRRLAAGAGGVTIAADLSFLSAVLKWARHARRLDIPDGLALDARAALKHRGLQTRSREREREPTDEELQRLYAYWADKVRQKIDMETICRFALATGMRAAEICRIAVEDIDPRAKTVVVRDRKDPRLKAGNNQTVPLLPDAWEIARRLMRGRTEGPLFDANEKSVSTAFTRACKGVQPPIEDLHFHDLRHRATAEFFRMGLDIPRVALLTGHKTWSMLRRYTAIKPEDVHQAVQQAARPSRAKQNGRTGRGNA
jgi:integrase